MNKASRDDGFPAEIFQILKYDAVKVLHSAVAKGLGKVSFHSNLKERQCQRMFKLLHNCIHLTCLQNNIEKSPSSASTVRELRTSRYSSWI